MRKIKSDDLAWFHFFMSQKPAILRVCVDFLHPLYTCKIPGTLQNSMPRFRD